MLQYTQLFLYHVTRLWRAQQTLNILLEGRDYYIQWVYVTVLQKVMYISKPDCLMNLEVIDRVTAVPHNVSWQ